MRIEALGLLTTSIDTLMVDEQISENVARAALDVARRCI